ncbi:efflux transporter periplasmic adaptor subunit [Mucilaginibacter sp. PPCGB 2223]|uniref:efflux RND transporter periplasmic adaptor subunit n=1 Tax=Mucilaginibacter sp. PPCGB 2223 TaxID=1886027 RepID=UPI0008271AAD|nr:efflux RND transporter periplasmic adaptor subunit [Mucilaginibacter sp. PPCGB 2223]OCX52824.1 efflux transporter periplasmic adaptor subunit [Mucilaginibacter sp. PPCGB 2223]
MNKRYVFTLGPAAMLMWATACKQPANPNAAAVPPTPVNLATATKANAVFYDQYPGTVVALNSVQLRAQVGGFITGIFFKEGDVVTKGQSLYEIDRRKYEAAYLQAKANQANAEASLVRAQKDADRYNQLLKQDAVARQLVDNANATLASSQSQVEAAKAAVFSAKTDLDYSIIRAPFTGRIGISQVKLGAQVTPGTTILNTISSEDPIAVDFVVDENSVGRFEQMKSKGAVNPDSAFRVKLSDNTTYPQPGKILVVDRGVDNQSGTIKVRIEFPNPKKQLVDGMSCTLQVLNNQSGEQIIIPYKAVVEQLGEYFVYVASDSTMKSPRDTTKIIPDTIAKQYKVKLGQQTGTNVVILSGIKEGDKVVTDGLQRLRDKGRIAVGKPKKPAQGQLKQ